MCNLAVGLQTTNPSARPASFTTNPSWVERGRVQYVISSVKESRPDAVAARDGASHVIDDRKIAQRTAYRNGGTMV
ncbi:hypothetical protein HSRCO_1870 [Halanaeroarchaeum sp. HSR-CO]|nr:hypothetical protein HSRCO_1870 [Halanaeroarchaeum sp. HSR-CO]